MLFLVLSVALALLVHKNIKLLPDDANPIIKKVVALLVSFALCVLLGFVVTEVYYSTYLPDISYDEIDVHPKTSIEVEQYVYQEAIVLMDRDHKLYQIDVDKAEITFSTNNDAAYIKTVKAKGVWKFIVFDQSRTSFAIQFYDPYARYSS